MITAKEVAGLSDVSISTVGRALADDPRISAETKARVHKTAAKLDYVENSAARIIRGGSSKLVGLMLPDIRNDFYSTIAEALSRCCDTEGYQVALSVVDDSESRNCVWPMVSKCAEGKGNKRQPLYGDRSYSIRFACSTGTPGMTGKANLATAPNSTNSSTQ